MSGHPGVDASCERPSAAYPRLLADIGGTHARLAWVQAPQTAPDHLQTLPVAAHTGPAQAVRAYLQTVQAQLGARWQAPRSAAFAVATAVSGDAVRFTNSPWAFSAQALRQELGLDALRVVNDFEALALALPRLQAAQWCSLGGPVPLLLQAAAQGQTPPPGTVLAVCGPGTGLGVAALVRTTDGWQALASEGGHATLAAADALQAEVIAGVRRQYAHVSAERLLCGAGLARLHVVLAAVLGRAAPPEGTPAAVVAAAQQGDDLAVRTLDLFVALLGGFAGNLALTLGARGGVFIGGGIVPRLSPRAIAGFRAPFEAKGRQADYLAAVPTVLITDTQAALGGLLHLNFDRP